ncbi:hypothetical protein [Geobacillus virus E2]|uniref:hypothetical protein n=1 Tax=Geobacillus virus E2 TaxID=447909 RepID=UPI00015367F5|nr:hypothetical protein GBVE2_p33 [Geobacillus virus E2]ABI36851.1 hypothetical protein [Geobacillus virus E2]
MLYCDWAGFSVLQRRFEAFAADCNFLFFPFQHRHFIPIPTPAMNLNFLRQAGFPAQEIHIFIPRRFRIVRCVCHHSFPFLITIAISIPFSFIISTTWSSLSCSSFRLIRSSNSRRQRRYSSIQRSASARQPFRSSR